MTDAAVATRESGRFVAGVSGNPKGRPPGSKNGIVARRNEIEQALLEHVPIERLKRIINKVAEQAENGDRASQKLIFDKLIANAAPHGEELADNGRTVVFRIENVTVGALVAHTPDKSAIIDVEHEVVSSEQA